MRKKILPEQIKVGMFIHAFGGSWFDHPFWRTKFIVRSAADAAKVRIAAIPYVEIDEALGASADVLPNLASPSLPAVPRGPSSAQRAGRAAHLLAGEQATNMAEMLQKHQNAQFLRVVNEAKATMRGLFDDARMGRAIRMHDTVKLIDDIGLAVARSPRTILDIVRLKKKDEYTFMHSVAVCTLMTNLATHLGKNEADIRDYGQAGLLHDIGKMGIPDHILNKPGPLTDMEFAAIRGHPEHGFQLLCAAGEVSQIALDVCHHHHEKQDGTGYPSHLGADDISEAVAFGAICDVYDALTSRRVYKPAYSPTAAVAKMWNSSGHFDAKQLFVFMQSIGIFPEGMLVRLRSNRLAVIRPARRKDAGPRAVAFFSARDREPIAPQELYLADGAPMDSIVAFADPAHWDLGDLNKLLANAA